MEDFMNNEENNHIHDLAFKDFLGMEEICTEFLKAFLSPEILESWKNITIKRMPTDFIDQYHKEKRADILVSIKNKKNNKQFAYVLFEHKFTVDKDISKQLLRYIACIAENQEKNEGRRLPIFYRQYHTHR